MLTNPKKSNENGLREMLPSELSQVQGGFFRVPFAVTGESLSSRMKDMEADLKSLDFDVQGATADYKK